MITAHRTIYIFSLLVTIGVINDWDNRHLCNAMYIIRQVLSYWWNPPVTSVIPITGLVKQKKGLCHDIVMKSNIPWTPLFQRVFIISHLRSATGNLNEATGCHGMCRGFQCESWLRLKNWIQIWGLISSWIFSCISHPMKIELDMQRVSWSVILCTRMVLHIFVKSNLMHSSWRIAPKLTHYQRKKLLTHFEQHNQPLKSINY